MTLTQPQRIGLFLVLALIMAGTRINHFGALPDASWAIFFVAGFYLRGSIRWAFPALMAIAVLVDYLVIDSQGLDFWSHYCVSPAYWFLLPAYAAMSLGGAFLRTRAVGHGRAALVWLCLSFVAAFCVCFLISNGSFYWLSSNVPVRSFSGWIENLSDWYGAYLRTSAAYVGIATACHLIGARWLAVPAIQAQHHSQRG